MKKAQRYFFYFIAVWCVMCLFIRCYMNLCGLQSGRTAGKGNIEVTGSRNYIQEAPHTFGDDGPPINSVEEDVKATEVDFRFGVSKRFDLGFSMGENRVGVNMKYNIVGNDSPFALGLGLSGGVTGYYGYSQANIFASLHPFEKLTLYASPGFARVNIGENNIAYRSTNILYLMGANFGFFFGKNLKAGIDFGYYKLDVGEKVYDVQNISLGVKLKLGKNGLGSGKNDEDRN